MVIGTASKIATALGNGAVHPPKRKRPGKYRISLVAMTMPFVSVRPGISATTVAPASAASRALMSHRPIVFPYSGPRLRKTVFALGTKPLAFGVLRCGAQINREMKFQIELVEKSCGVAHSTVLLEKWPPMHIAGTLRLKRRSMLRAVTPSRRRWRI
jgi:hypothetical protein